MAGVHWGSAPCDASAWVYSQDDKVAGARLDGLERRLQRLRAEQSELTERWESERALMDSLQSVKDSMPSERFAAGQKVPMTPKRNEHVLAGKGQRVGAAPCDHR